MKLSKISAEVFIPDNIPLEAALSRTTHLVVAAHPDDVEIMAPIPILSCIGDDKKSLSAIVVTDGRSSPRGGKYRSCSDEEIRIKRRKEQRKAAVIGEYSALIFLDYTSEEIKSRMLRSVISDLVTIFSYSQPGSVFTHNLADKHDTHIAVALSVIFAIRELPETERPGKLLGCEVWRDLDWMLDSDKVLFDTSSQENLQSALIGVHDSQIDGGKRVDLAVLGRNRAHGTFFSPHAADKPPSLAFAMDLSPLLHDIDRGITEFVSEYIRRFEMDVINRIQRFGISDLEIG
jgi:LmbE family N-acetylglucosaminyl deacetylase